MKKVTNKKGFTLAELLIVVAIIAVLVAIAVPVFGTALDKAQLAADAANVRAVLAEEIVDAMTDNTFAGNVTIALADITGAADGANTTVTVDDAAKTITLTCTRTGTTVDPIIIQYDADVSIA